MCEEPSSLLRQVHNLVESREKELDEVDVEVRQPVQSCALNLQCRLSFREWRLKAEVLLCRAVDVTDFLKAHANLARDRQALELEKEQMQHVSVAENDIVTLNVGGTILCTNRSTLTQVSAQVCAPCCSMCALVCTCCKGLFSCIAALWITSDPCRTISLEHRFQGRAYHACCLCNDNTLTSGLCAIFSVG